MGSSPGAVVAATIAAHRPDLVRRLVPTAGRARPDPPYPTTRMTTRMTTWAGLADDLRPLLPRVTAETPVTGCTKDGTVRFALTRELADAVPGARFEALESGHVVVHEQPGAFVALVAGFTA
ncbi:alpha/beta fold hydrolase [Kitasatospora phosalacinea]|uniref:Uncharacterized protein n=1 Tax=Kitasatospora phosalacinea TaxID=2065 RepID=A0A9W6PEP4_9ACTN|nr:hypothetical protein [Kitasatospora phosalacinea]GLW54605.1 hypothetical protein Kpho01_26160 [Kitasatospora phosalacinea]